MAVLKTVQSGTAVIATSTTTKTVTITSIDTTKSFLVFSARGNSSEARKSWATGQITNGTTLTFQRNTASGGTSVEISWYVMEFTSGVSVQRGSQSVVTPLPKNVTITAVTLAKSFPLISYRVEFGTGPDGRAFPKAKLTTTTNLEIDLNVPPLTGIVEWQVIEFTGADVQTGDLTLSTTDTSKTDTITSVDTAKSWLIFSQKNDEGTGTNVASHTLRGRITNGTTLTFDRDEAGSLAIDVTWYVIEFTDGTKVQSGSENFGTGDTLKNVTITAVDLTKTMASAGGLFQRWGKTAENTSGSYVPAQNTLTLTTTTNLQIERTATDSATADVSWFVIEFAAAVARRIFVVT